MLCISVHVRILLIRILQLEMDHKQIVKDMSEIDGIIKGLKPGDASMMKPLVESLTKYEVACSLISQRKKVLVLCS